MSGVARAFVLLLLSASSAWAQSVGVRDRPIPGDQRIEGFTARVWYPTTSTATETVGASRIRQGYVAAPDASPALSQGMPLVVLTHGSGGSADSMGWIAVELVRRMGAIVVAANHPGSSGGDPERASILEVWRQPADVSHLLDDILRSEWAPFIDDGRIDIVGFSLGGSSAMLLAGARFDFERAVRFCERHHDGACRAFEQHFERLDAAFFRQSNANWSDDRFRRAVAIAPGFTEAMTAPSLAAMPTPLLLIAASADQQLPTDTRVRPMLAHLPDHSRYVEMHEAQHFSFLPLCTDQALPLLAESNEEFVCEEVGERERASIHRETLDAVIGFLRP